MTNEISSSILSDAHVDAVELDIKALMDAPAFIKVRGAVSIGANRRDQLLMVDINGDRRAGEYIGTSIDNSPGYHADIARSANNSIIAGFTGWGLDGDIMFEFTLSGLAGMFRVATGNYTTIHNDGRQYLSQIGGCYRNKAIAIEKVGLWLPNGGVFRTHKLIYSASA